MSGEARGPLDRLVSTGNGAWVVVPTYDERGTLVELVRRVNAVLPEAHLLIVDDASPDGTGDLAAELAHRDSRVHLLQRHAKLGLGTAYVAGFRRALKGGADVAIEMDGDLSHDPADLPRLLHALASGADLAVGSRDVPGGGVVGWGPGRHMLSKGGSLYARLVLGVPTRDLTTGFKAWTRRALEVIDLERIRSNGYAFQVETTYRALRAGLVVEEVPIVFSDRRVGRSKMSRAVFAEAVWRVPWMRWSR